MASPHPLPTPVPTERRNSSNLFQCGTCSQSFTRIDHLGRHVRSRSHTGARCAISGSVACKTNEDALNLLTHHRDLLSRHSALHNAQREGSTPKRRRNAGNAAPSRASQACEACAVDHLRCDDEKPCRRCERRGIICALPVKVAGGHTPPVTIVTPADHQPEPPISQDAGDMQSTPALQPQWAVGPGTNSHHNGRLMQGTAGIPADMDGPLPCASPISRGELVTFGWETNLDLSVMDLSFLESYNVRAPFEYEAATVSTVPPPVQEHEDESLVTERSAIEERSSQRIRWRFVPAPQDNGYAEHGNLLLNNQTGADATPQSLRDLEMGPGPDDSVDLASRDKILSIVLSQMPHPFSLNAASFPSPELLDRLIRYYLSVPSSNPDVWIHPPTFTTKGSPPELLLAMAAAGAVLTPDPALRRLGFAMQEVLRHQLPAVFEGDNTLIRQLELHQAFLVGLEMELCETERHALITMVRRRGRFDAAKYPPITVNTGDSGEMLEDIWRLWVREESTKRLAYRLWQHDTQCSIVLGTSPLISYAELSLPLPASPALWNAPTAERWRDLFCLQQSQSQSGSHTPSLTECVMNMDLLDNQRNEIDMTLSCTGVVQAIWGLAWDGSANAPPRAWSASLLMASRYQQLTEMLDYFGIAYRNESSLYWNKIQLLATTLEQPERGTQMPPAIQAWSASRDGRLSVWHAAQIVCEVRVSRPQCIRAFPAVALYQATLALWAYGVGVATHNAPETSTTQEPVRLDGVEDEHIRRFISFGRGRPMLRGELTNSDFVNLWDPTAVLNMSIRLMRDNHSAADALPPPLVESLVHAMQKLVEVTTWWGQAAPR
ncbi:hypothetical protein BJY01DRAFT_263779 [Aspergillus pseudoustus]|uniref:Zn(2)-C6 fungal-type domain-containing protein n=1 Tax=Aspergillus pseudoustus TaxID=1810923 RepID=A0ABR4K0Z3_9EURO